MEIISCCLLVFVYFWVAWHKLSRLWQNFSRLWQKLPDIYYISRMPGNVSVQNDNIGVWPGNFYCRFQNQFTDLIKFGHFIVIFSIMCNQIAEIDWDKGRLCVTDRPFLSADRYSLQGYNVSEKPKIEVVHNRSFSCLEWFPLLSIHDALFTSIALWWLVLKKKLPRTQCFAKGRKQIFCTNSLFNKVKNARATSLEIQAGQLPMLSKNGNVGCQLLILLMVWLTHSRLCV